MGLRRQWQGMYQWLVNPAGCAKAEDYQSLAQQARSTVSAGDAADAATFASQTPREQWSDGQLTEFLASAYSAAENALGLPPFDCQLLATANLLKGRVIDMKTGEGKTLVGAIAAVGYALQGRPVHVLTVNDYLAQRDAQWMQPLFETFGLNVGYITAGQSAEEKRHNYTCDVTYVSVNQLGFDVLTDRAREYAADTLVGTQDVCLIDEVDAVLVDEATVPLVLAGQTATAPIDMSEAGHFVTELVPDEDYVVETDGHNVSLTDAGIEKAHQRWPDQELFSGESPQALTAINLALHAHTLVHRGVDYLVADGQVKLISASRGRIATTQRWPHGLHTAVEAKEGLTITEQGQVLDQLLIRSLIDSFTTVVGMSGTAAAVADHLREAYGVETAPIAPRLEVARIDEPDRMYATAAERDCALLDEVERLHHQGGPVLVATGSVTDSYRIGKALQQRGIEASVLNAENDSEEAELIARAGHTGAVTVSTQMAGRGIDIRLKGDIAQEEGLTVLGLERFYTRRLDDQLRGRAGRQGDPGRSVFFTSLEDHIIGVSGQQPPTPRSIDENGRITETHMQGWMERVQRIVEARYEALHKSSWTFNELLDNQRTQVLAQREELLTSTQAPSFLTGEPRFEELVDVLGDEAAGAQARQLVLYCLDAQWAEHLNTTLDIRSAIHFRSLARQDPLFEYKKESMALYKGFFERVKIASQEALTRTPVGPEGLDFEHATPLRPASTWTYMINADSLGSPEERAVRWMAETVTRGHK